MSTPDFIFVPNKRLADQEEDCFFCLLKDKDFVDENNNPRSKTEDDIKVLAKIKHKQNGASRHLIRIDTSKKLFNPILDLPETRNIKMLHGIPGQQMQFKEVSKKTFDLYLMFLKTDNTSWILNAEREGI